MSDAVKYRFIAYRPTPPAITISAGRYLAENSAGQLEPSGASDEGTSGRGEVGSIGPVFGVEELTSKMIKVQVHLKSREAS
jgi:hypothetical protein